MAYSIQFTQAALEQLRRLQKREQGIIIEGIKLQLVHEPFTQTRNRKPLRTNPLSRWELRIEKYRVFYDESEDNRVVEIKAIGYKEHNRLFIGGKEFEI